MSGYTILDSAFDRFEGFCSGFDRGKPIDRHYIEAFLENVNWEVVEQRHKDSKAGRFTARF